MLALRGGPASYGRRLLTAPSPFQKSEFVLDVAALPAPLSERGSRNKVCGAELIQHLVETVADESANSGSSHMRDLRTNHQFALVTSKPPSSREPARARRRLPTGVCQPSGVA